MTTILDIYLNTCRQSFIDHFPQQLRRQQLSQTMSGFLELPIDIIRCVCDHLPLDALVALKLTHTTLRNIVGNGNLRQFKISPSRCEKRAIKALKSPPLAGWRYCYACNATIATRAFNSGNGAACRPRSSGQPVVELPSWLCSWHVGRLTRYVTPWYELHILSHSSPDLLPPL